MGRNYMSNATMISLFFLARKLPYTSILLFLSADWTGKGLALSLAMFDLELPMRQIAYYTNSPGKQKYCLARSFFMFHLSALCSNQNQFNF
jgi:hypothetical protein